MKGEKVWKYADYFFVFVFVLFCFSLFEATAICLGFTKMETSTRKEHFTLGKIRKVMTPNGNLYQKKVFHTGKNQGSDFPPPPQYSFYATVPTFLNINSLYNYLPISSLENSYHIVRQWCAFSPMGLTGIPHANSKLLCIIKHWFN